MNTDTYTFDLREPAAAELYRNYAVCCARCHRTLPASMFKRFLSEDQSDRRGGKARWARETPRYNSSNSRRKQRPKPPMKIESSVCADCRGEPRSVTACRTLSRAKLEAMVEMEHPWARHASLELHRRDKDGTQAQARAGRLGAELRELHRGQEPWRYIRKRIATERRRLSNQSFYYRNKLDEKVYSELAPAFAALLACNDAIVDALSEASAFCTHKAMQTRSPRPPEDHLTWSLLLGTGTHAKLRELWMGVPEQVRKRLKAPMVLSSMHDNRCLHGYEHKPRDSQSAQTRAAKRARLKLIKGD